MLTAPLTIPKNRKLSPAEDYQLLRKAGLEYIESLGSDLWTDYNVHDPGITIMEALCYAITELGYRTNIDVADLLTEPEGEISADQPFYTAREILTCSPVTINDYRKLLVDIVGVHNAWLYATDRNISVTGAETPVNEVPLFADCKKDELTVKQTEHQLFLSGLYKVLVDLDNDDQFGDLNKGDIEVFNPVSTGMDPKFNAGDIPFTIELPHIHDANLAFATAAADKNNITKIEVVLQDGKWFCTVTTDNGEPAFKFIITVNIKPPGKTIELADMQDFFSSTFVSQVFYLYLQKLLKIQQVLLLAKETLHANRNLCEDLISITTVRDEEIAICCDIDVRPDADMEKIQAEVFYAIENYLNPSINFYLLKELLAKGKRADEVFEGPKLMHGFIDTAELEATQLRQVIYTSDIINLLMDIEGVLAVKNVMLTKYDESGTAVKNYTGLKWCMHIQPSHKPVLSILRSKVVFFKSNFPFLASYTEIRDSLKLLRASRERPKLQGQQDDLEVPKGIYHNLADYYSIQNDLPQTYGVGEAGLPLTATAARKAQAKQLKAYLLFYDQLLAGFFSQLANAGSLFSLKDIKQTYFNQFLHTIPGIDPVYVETVPGNAALKDVFANPDSTVSSANAGWKSLVENEHLYEDRRNRFLDHLLARFAESFNEYVLMMYSINHKDRTAESLSAAKIISNKIDFIREYPVISYSRGTGFNYYPLTAAKEVDVSKLWDSSNVSGLEKRSAKLAGIKNYFRRFLSCIKNIEIKTEQEDVVAEDNTILVKTYYTFTFQNKKGNQLTAKEKFESREDLEKLLAELISLMADKANYLYDHPSGKLEIINGESKVIATSVDGFTSKSIADKAIKQFVQEQNENCADAEGLLLIEHILLRPRTPQYKLMQVCLDKNCDFCGEEDPYSFRASIYLPYWPDTFNSMPFRTYFENMVRAEAPAHIMLKVCWLSNTDMRKLEAAYKTWVCALADYTHDSTSAVKSGELKDANDALVEIMKQVKSVYPEATLHDCDESVNTNPVMLGKTILGTIKPKSNE